MQTDIWVAIVIAAIGTYALRAVPLVWTQRHFNRRKGGDNEAHLPMWWSVLGPLMIAAMLGTSLIPKVPTEASWLATVVGSLVTAIMWRKFRTLGLPVLGGVLAFGLELVVFT